MDLIVGGGTYGLLAAQFCIKEGRSAKVIDPDPGCRAARFLAMEPQKEIEFICGEIPEACCSFSADRPARVFPTAPVHVAARMIAMSCRLQDCESSIGRFIAKVPEAVRAGKSGADAYFSFNPEGTCIPDCPSPECCPVTGEDRTIPLFARLREWCPDAVILESVQQAPGLGAICGTDLAAAIDRCRDRAEVFVGTACRCHGVVTALCDREPARKRSG